jgi:protease I
MRPTPLEPERDRVESTTGGDPRSRDLSCYRVAFLVSDGFERSELHEPLEAVKEAGAQAVVLTPDGDAVRSWDVGDWGDTIDADGALADAHPEHFDAVVLPGGVINPDQLRIDEHAVAFVRSIAALGRPIAAICHGPWTLIDAEVVEGRRMTSWPSLKSDLRNAGATWVDEDVVVDGGLVTSRKPSDLPAFCDALLQQLGSTTAAAEAK